VSVSIPATRGRASLEVLGCAKNQVEAETLSSRLAGLGWELAAEPSEADVIVVHTCGFLESARLEASEAVARLRRSAPRAFIVVSGCFAQFLGGKVPPGADAALGTGELDRLPELLESRAARGFPCLGPEARGAAVPIPSSGVGRRRSPPSGYHDASFPRPLRMGQLSAYLRVSEGCDRRCTFCLIPQLRGKMKSRFPKEILAEARGLVERGVEELVLISQDTTAFGDDLRPRMSLPRLAEEMVSWDGVRWLRLLYAHPAGVDERLIRLLAGERKLCGYLDMPLQHLSDPVLKAMGRTPGESGTFRLLDRLREKVPGLALRTTFIVGFPGETDRDFRRMARGVEEGRFEHVGVFVWSPEDRTPSARLRARVPPAVAEERRRALLDAQSAVMDRRGRARIGEAVEVMIESSPRGWAARAPWQAPEVDGGVLLDRYPGRSGFFTARITGRKGIDLTAELVDHGDAPRLRRKPGFRGTGMLPVHRFPDRVMHGQDARATSIS